MTKLLSIAILPFDRYRLPLCCVKVAAVDITVGIVVEDAVFGDIVFRFTRVVVFTVPAVFLPLLLLL